MHEAKLNRAEADTDNKRTEDGKAGGWVPTQAALSVTWVHIK
jgi:hypothetical protein